MPPGNLKDRSGQKQTLFDIQKWFVSRNFIWYLIKRLQPR
jgi:hypothetical protein